MSDRTRELMRGFTLAAVLCALAGCGESDEPKAEEERRPDPTDPVEVAASELGAEIDGCDDTGFADNTLTLDLDMDPAVISAPGGKITVNGYLCTGMVGTAMGAQLTTMNVKKIAINGTAGDDKVILDSLPGSFGTTILGNMGGITIDYSDGGNDSFMLRGTTSADRYRFGQSTDDIYVEITGDKVADIWIQGAAATPIAIAASMGGGADTVAANPAAALDFNSFAGGAITVTPPTNAITAYGGLLADTFTGGDGDDTFYGGDGDDVFKTIDADDGADTYIGDDGSDTVDYSLRSMAVNADIGPAKVSILGDADLAETYAMVGTQTLLIDLDGAGAPVTVTFATPTTAAAVVSQINATGGLNGVASLTGKNQLLLSALTSTMTSEIEITGGTALTALGLMTGSATTIMNTAIAPDADDGYASEGDDIRTTTENITGGAGDDTLVGDEKKNTLKGGAGNDDLMGGGNTTCNATADGDVLQGEAGDDTFWVPVANCFAALTGGAGSNIVTFSARTAAVSLSNNGTANDGDPSGNGEKVNIATDILTMAGGFGADTLTGGMGNDTLIGGLGGDVLSGGAGTDDIAPSFAMQSLMFVAKHGVTPIAVVRAL